MKTFEVRSPSGKVYEIQGETAPSGAQIQAIIQSIQGDEKKVSDLSSVNAKFAGQGVSPESAVRFGNRVVSNVGDLVSGLGAAALDAGKSALSLEGQASYLPRMAKGMYDGAVQYGADAIARQLPNGAEEATPGQMVKAGIAAVPVVGGYAMNRATDVAEGKAPEALADVVTDAATMLVPGSGPGRAGLARTASGATRAAEATATGLGKAAVKVGPEVAGMVAGGAVSGGLGGIAGGIIAHEAKAAVVKWLKNRFKVPDKIAEDLAAKMKPEQAALIAEREAALEAREAVLEAKQVAAVEDKVIKREVSDAKKQVKFDRKEEKIRPIPPSKLPPVLPDPVVPELGTAPVKVPKAKPAPRVKAEPAKAPEPVPVAPKGLEMGKRYSKEEMIAKGADGNLSHGTLMEIPVSKVSGREPVPAMEGGYKKGTPITQPIEVVYDRGEDVYHLYAGNHRITQADLNGQATIPAFVENAPRKSVPVAAQDAPVAAQVPPQAPIPPKVTPVPSEPGQTAIAKYYNLHTERSLPEGAVGVHPTLGLPMNAEGKVLVRNVEDFASESRIPGSQPEGNTVWRDPNRSFFGNPSVQEMADILQARADAAKPSSSLADQMRAIGKGDGVDRMKVPKVSERHAEEMRRSMEKAKEYVAKKRAALSDVVTAPPAFEGQQSAKGATKARFHDVAKRAVEGWMKSDKPDKFIADKLQSMFKMSGDDAEKLIREVGGKG